MSEPSFSAPSDGTGAAVRPHLVSLTYEARHLPGGVEVIALSGELDGFTAGLELRELFEQRAARGDNVVLDLSKVAFIDSMGLSALATAHRRLCSLSRVLVLLAPSATVLQVLRLTGLDHHIPVAESVDDVGKLLEQQEAEAGADPDRTGASRD